jgi:hypothetical protein
MTYIAPYPKPGPAGATGQAFINLDGGGASTQYGGVTPINCGGATGA